MLLSLQATLVLHAIVARVES